MSRNEVLRSLLQKRGSWVSGEEIGSSLGVSRAAVWKGVNSLRSEGYEIESSSGRGYRLVGDSDILAEELIVCDLKTEFVGRPTHFYKEVVSTNAVAKEVASSASNGTAILAEVQTGGRGRMDRPWHSPSGGVWISVILKPKFMPAEAFKVNLTVSVALARALFHLYGLDVGIKWPNDLIVGNKKICGVLTEIGAEMDGLDYAVVGMGINANVDPDSFPEEWKATSLSCELGRDVSRVELIQRILFEVERAYKEMLESFELISNEWAARSVTLKRRVKIITRTSEFEGVATTLEEDGALRVRRDDGTETKVMAGDCVHLRPS